MTRINLPTERQVGHLTLLRQGRKLSLKEYNALTTTEQLEMIRQAHGKQKYDLIINSDYAATLTPQLHPQELYLTINELGAEYAIELLMLADPEQIITLLDLDCWNRDSLSEILSLHWLELLLNTGEKQVCRLAKKIESEIWALFLKKHLTIIRGLEAYDDDDADNARRLESIYDIEYASENAAKIIGALLQIIWRHDQETYLLIMETIRSENLSLLEEEVFQARNNRMLDLGFIPSMEAKSIYNYIDPAHFITGGKKNFKIEAEGLPHPGALLARAEPDNLLAEVLTANLDHDLASELCLLVNRKMSADATDLSSINDVTESLQSIYDTLNLSLEYLADENLAKAEEAFQQTYLLNLFQLGHSLIHQRQQKAEKILQSPIGPFLDYPEQLFVDSLLQQPACFYSAADDDHPSRLQPLTTMKTLKMVDQRLSQLAALQTLFCEMLPFSLPEETDLSAEIPTLSILFLTAVANQLLGRPFLPKPMTAVDILRLKEITIRQNNISTNFQTQLYNLVNQLTDNCGFFIEFCLECWKEDLSAADSVQPGNRSPICLLMEN